MFWWWRGSGGRSAYAQSTRRSIQTDARLTEAMAAVREKF
jgi:hypothetical protein